MPFSFGKSMEEIGAFWSGVLPGGSYHTPSPQAHYEEIEGQIYDVGEIVHDYSHEWIGVAPNFVTPAQLRHLLAFLDEFTSQLEEADLSARSLRQGPDEPPILIDGEPVIQECEDTRPGFIQPCIDLERWRIRLDEYEMLVNLVPPEEDGNRELVLWDVTAPLFVGWYGGPTGTDVSLPPGGFPPGFNTDMRHPPDIGTPYMLANQYGIEAAWEKTRREKLREDLGLGPSTWAEIKKLLIYAGAGAAGLVVLNALLRR